VGRYLEHLERAFLLSRLKNFAAATDRSRPRLFPIDPGLSNALFDHGPGVLAAGCERRALLSAAIVAHVESAASERGFDVAYFRDGDLEADVVLVSPEGVVPILVADQDEAGEEQAAQAEKIMQRTGAQVAYLLSRTGPRRTAALTFFETVFHLPAAYFLYALGG